MATLNVTLHPSPDGPTVPAELTTERAESSYGVPVLVIDAAREVGR